MTGDVLDRRLRAWRRALVVGALLLAAYLPLEAHYPAPLVPVLTRLGWILFLLAVVPLLRPARPRVARISAHIVGLVSGVCGSAIIAFTGGSHGPRFGFLLAYPLVFLVLAPDLPWTAGLMGLGSLGGGLAILMREGRDGWFVGEWVLLSMATTVLAIVGARSFRRVWLSEIEAQQARGDLAARLAEVERLARVGSLARSVAHEINNPLAAVKANVQWLKEQPCSTTQGDEVAQALRDAESGSERVARVVSEMLALSPDNGGRSVPCALDGAVVEAVRRHRQGAPSTEVVVALPPDLPPVRAHHDQVVRALTGLLREASGDALDVHPVCVNGSADAGTVKLVIASAPARAWSPIAEAEHGASRLWFILAREHVEQCGGTVQRVWQGTRAAYLVELPVWQEPTKQHRAC